MTENQAKPYASLPRNGSGKPWDQQITLDDGHTVNPSKSGWYIATFTRGGQGGTHNTGATYHQWFQPFDPTTEGPGNMFRSMKWAKAALQEEYDRRKQRKRARAAAALADEGSPRPKKAASSSSSSSARDASGNTKGECQ